MSTRPPLGEWSPGLDDAATLRSVYGRMPGDTAAAIPWYPQDEAVEFARNSAIRPLLRVAWRDHLDRSPGELRAELGVGPRGPVAV